MEDLKPIILPGVSSQKPMIIAGPCSAETEEQVMETAKNLAKNGVTKHYQTVLTMNGTYILILDQEVITK